MSLLQLAHNIRAIGLAHANTKGLLQQSGEILAREFKDNIDRSQVAGEHRPAMDTAPTRANEPMTRLAAYTIEKRLRAGIHHDHPLKATGRMYREIGIRGLTSQRVIVGGTTPRARRLLRIAMGTGVTGILSSDLKQVIPPRGPVGYRDRTAIAILDMWNKALLPLSSISVTANVNIRL